MICSFFLFWVLILFTKGSTQRNPPEISKEYEFTVSPDYAPPEVYVAPQVFPTLDLSSEIECEGLFSSGVTITDLMRTSLPDIYVDNLTEE